ncbi:MAG: ATP-binding protein [Planctomycetota bacterium]
MRLRDLTIGAKIWLSISALLAVYAGHMTLTFFQGLRTERQLEQTIARLAPAAQMATAAASAFDDQVAWHERAVADLDADALGAAQAKAAEVQTQYARLYGVEPLPPVLRERVRLLRGELDEFARRAHDIYAAFIADQFDERAVAAAAGLHAVKEDLKRRCEAVEGDSAQALEDEIATLAAHSKLRRRVGLGVFMVVLLASVSFLGLTIRAWITRPLGQTLRRLQERGSDFTRISQGRDEIHTFRTAFDDMCRIIDTQLADLRQEVAERRRAEERSATFRQLAEVSTQAFSLCDLDGRLTWVNPAFAAMLGLERAASLGERLDRFLVPVAGGNQSSSALHRAMKQGSFSTAAELRGAGGHSVHTLQHFAVICDRDGQPLCIANVLTDISELKRTQEQLAELNCTLEHRVEQRTVELREANASLTVALDDVRSMQEHLVQAEKLSALGGMVAGVAHEINTPVGVGITAASLLVDELERLRRDFAQEALKRSQLADFIERTAEAAGIIQANLERAGELVRSFKQVAADQSSGAPREFALLDYTREVLKNLEPQLKRTRHRLEIAGDADIVVRSFPGPFAQVLTNLFTNALDHAFDGVDQGTIRVSVERESATMAVVRCSDDGVGMDPATREQVFAPFFTTRRGRGGTGLGLHLAFNLVAHKLGGTLTCTSTPGAGSSFMIRLPLRRNLDGVEITPLAVKRI